MLSTWPWLPLVMRACNCQWRILLQAGHLLLPRSSGHSCLGSPHLCLPQQHTSPWGRAGCHQSWCSHMTRAQSHQTVPPARHKQHVQPPSADQHRSGLPCPAASAAHVPAVSTTPIRWLTAHAVLQNHMHGVCARPVSPKSCNLRVQHCCQAAPAHLNPTSQGHPGAWALRVD